MKPGSSVMGSHIKLQAALEAERREYVVTGGCVVMMPRPITGRGFLYRHRQRIPQAGFCLSRRTW